MPTSKNGMNEIHYPRYINVLCQFRNIASPIMTVHRAHEFHQQNTGFTCMVSIFLKITLGFLLFVTYPVHATEILENFDSNTGFSKLIVSGDYKLASFKFVNGQLELSQKPRSFYNSAKISKSYTVDLSQTTLFEFRIRMAELLLGQDSYTTLNFIDSQGKLIGHVTIGINSEQHWRQVYVDGTGDAPCSAKSVDDEFFISVSPSLFKGAPDTRLRYPPNVRARLYTDWTIFSVRYDPPGSSGDPFYGRFTFFVDGQEVQLEDLDAPGKTIVPKTNALNNLGLTTVKLDLSVLNDGFDNGYTGNKYGTRGRGCYAPQAPAIPSALLFPKEFLGNNGLSYKPGWMKRFDAVASVMLSKINTFHPNIPQLHIRQRAAHPIGIPKR